MFTNLETANGASLDPLVWARRPILRWNKFVNWIPPNRASIRILQIFRYPIVLIFIYLRFSTLKILAIYSAVKQIYKLNTSKSEPNPDSQDEKDIFSATFIIRIFEHIWIFINLAVKQIYKLNSFESGFNPDSPNGKGDQRITHNGNTSILFDPLYAYNKISISLYARIGATSVDMTEHL